MLFRDDLPKHLEYGYKPKKIKRKNRFTKRFSKYGIDKKWIVIIIILVIILLIALICRPYIRLVRNVFIVKDMFSGFKVEAKYQASDFVDANKDIKDLVDKIGLEVRQGQIKGEKKDSKLHGYVYPNKSNDQVGDFYLLPEDITINLRTVVEIVKNKGGIMGGILSIIPFEDKEFISLKEAKALKPDFKFEQPKPVIKRIVKQIVKNFRNSKMPDDTVFKNEISNYHFFKTKVEKVNIVAGIPKKIEKEKSTIYLKVTIGEKDAEILAVVTKLKK